MSKYKRGDFVYYIKYETEPTLCRVIDFVEVIFEADMSGAYTQETEYVLLPVIGNKTELWAFITEMSDVTGSLVQELYA